MKRIHALVGAMAMLGLASAAPAQTGFAPGTSFNSDFGTPIFSGGALPTNDDINALGEVIVPDELDYSEVRVYQIGEASGSQVELNLDRRLFSDHRALIVQVAPNGLAEIRLAGIGATLLDLRQRGADYSANIQQTNRLPAFTRPVSVPGANGGTVDPTYLDNLGSAVTLLQGSETTDGGATAAIIVQDGSSLQILVDQRAATDGSLVSADQTGQWNTIHVVQIGSGLTAAPSQIGEAGDSRIYIEQHGAGHFAAVTQQQPSTRAYVFQSGAGGASAVIVQ